MIVNKINQGSGFGPDIPEALLPHVTGYSLNEDGETYTLTLNDEKLRISPGQGKTMLDTLGLYETVENMVAQSPRPVQIFWSHATEWFRFSPTILAFGEQLNIDLDEFFEKARKIQI